MHLTRYTDYSLRVLLHAASRQGGLASISEIARIQGISKNHVMKVVNQLANDGFLRTIRGRGGGFTLARAPEDIRIGDVVRQTEPDLKPADCGNCVLQVGCGLAPLLDEAMTAFLDTLDRYTLADAIANRRSGTG